MDTDLSHLPARKRDELARIVRLINDAFGDPGGPGGVEMIILFGSYARGDWKEESDLPPPGQRRSGHPSDYDILVVTAQPEAAEDTRPWREVAEQCRAMGLSAHVRIIAHDIEFVNARLRQGQYFFADIKREGRMLHDSGRTTLADAADLSDEERRRIAQKYFESGYEAAQQFLKIYTFCFDDHDYKRAAFQLHQAAEAAYKTILLVCTGYSPHEHLLDLLGMMAARHDPSLANIFPRETAEQRRRFEALDYAYIGARYDVDFRIAPEDLSELAACVRTLLTRTKTVCAEALKP